MSATAGFLALASEAVANYGVDAIDPKGTPAVDLEFLRFRQFDVAKNVQEDEVATVLPSFSRHPHVDIPRNLTYQFESAIYEARDPGVSGGEAPPGFQEAIVASGFEANLAGGAGSNLVITPSTFPTASMTVYRWELVLHDATPKWTLYRCRGCRNSEFSFGGEVGAVATFAGSGASGNFPRDSSETANPFGRTEPLAFFDIDAEDLLLDQFGDAVAWTGSWEHALYTPMVTTYAQVEIANTFAQVQDWRITVTNQIDEAPILVGGEVLYEQRIVGRDIAFTATLKDRDAYLTLIEGVRSSLTGTPGDELITLQVVMDDGKGAGGTTYTIDSELQFSDPEDGESNGTKNWAINGKSTPDWSTSFAGDDELTVTISQTA